MSVAQLGWLHHHDPGWDCFCQTCIVAGNDNILMCKQCYQRARNTEYMNDCIARGELKKAYQYFISRACRPAHRLLQIHPGYLYALTFYNPGKRPALCRVVRAISICVLDWLKMVGWLDRTPCLVAQRLTETVLCTDYLGDHCDVHLSTGRNGIAWRSAVELVAVEFDRTWRAMKESVAAHGVPIGERVAKRRRLRSVPEKVNTEDE